MPARIGNATGWHYDPKAAHEEPEEVDVQVLRSSERIVTNTEPRPLQTLHVTIGGARVSTTRAVAVEGVNITVARDAKRRIGIGFQEHVQIVTDGIGMRINSALGSRLKSEADRIRHYHLDLTFDTIDTTSATGALPEIWGVRPMSPHTVSFMTPNV